MVEFFSLAISGVVLYYIVYYILVKKLVDIVTSFFLNKTTLIVLVIGIVLYMVAPDIVAPYYQTIGEYILNGLKGLWDLLWGFFSDFNGLSN